jgi:hypothetical protein
MKLDQYYQSLETLKDANESFDGIMLDLIHNLFTIDGEELSDRDMIYEIIDLINIWKGKVKEYERVDILP